MPNTELKLLDDDGNEVGPGMAGEIAIRAPGDGRLLAAPDETAKVMTADGFFRTGDIGTVDERGYFRIVDRKKDMILVSGFNVYPERGRDVVSRSCPACWAPPSASRTPRPAGGQARHRAHNPALSREAEVRPLRNQPHRLQAAQDRPSSAPSCPRRRWQILRREGTRPENVWANPAAGGLGDGHHPRPHLDGRVPCTADAR